MNRKRAALGLLLIAVVAGVIWFFNREVPPIWYTGTAPNPNNLLAIRPTTVYPPPPQFSKTIKLFVDQTPLNTKEIILKRNQEVRLHGELTGGPLHPNSRVLAVELYLSSHADNSHGFIMEGITDIMNDSFSKHFSMIKDYDYQSTVDTQWTIPDHAGDFNLEIVMHVVVPGKKDAARHVVFVCPVKVE